MFIGKFLIIGILFFIIIIALPLMLFSNIARFLFGKRRDTQEPMGQQRQSSSGRTTWHAPAEKDKKIIRDDEGEYIDFEEVKEK